MTKVKVVPLLINFPTLHAYKPYVKRGVKKQRKPNNGSEREKLPVSS